MNKRDTKNAGWFAEFEARCKAHGIKIIKLFEQAGLKDSRIYTYRSGTIPTAKTRVKLEAAYAEISTPQVTAPEPDKKVEKPKRRRYLCEGDKTCCPYLRIVEGKLGYCPLPYCIWRNQN